jgi:CubicO group peptidase (beta-lactamase class C family)
LNEGKWGEEQIVPSEWVEEATTPSQDLNRSYGYLWWLNTPSKKQDGGDQATGGTATTSSGPPRRQMVEGAPNDAFFALGLGNQVVSVLPSEGIVAVRLGTGSNRSFGVKELTLGVLDAAGVPASK